MMHGPGTPVEQIAKQGDALDIVVSQRFRNDLRVYGGVSTGVFLGMFGTDFGYTPNLIDTIAPVMYSVPTVATAVTINSLSRYGFRRKQERSANSQAAIREELDESVDLFKGSKKQGGNLLRWYGLDLADEPADDAGRLSKLIGYMEEHDIPRIAFSARRLDLPKDISDFGVIADGIHVVPRTKSKVKRSFSALELRDDRLDEDMLICTVEQARKVAEKLHSEESSTLLSRLIKIADVPELGLALNQMHAGRATKMGLRNKVHRQITLYLDGKMPLDMVVEEGMNGKVRGIQTSTFTISGKTIHSFGDARFRGGVRQSNWASSQSIPEFCDATTKDELVERTIDTNNNRTAEERKKDALFAAYLHLLDDAEIVDQMTESAFGNVHASAHHTPPPTTLELLPGKHGVRVGASSNADVELYRQGNRLGRGFLKLSGLVLSVALGYGAQGALAEVWNASYEKVSSACDTTAKNWREAHPDISSPYEDRSSDGPCDNDAVLKATIKQNQGLQAQATFSDMMSSIYEENARLQAGIVNTALRMGINPPKSWSDSVLETSRLFDDIAKYVKIPPAVMIGRDSEPGIGDVPVAANDELYHITPLTGESPSGYWYSGVYDIANLRPAPGIYDADNFRVTVNYEASENKPNHLHVDSEATTVQAIQPDFAVTTLLPSYDDSEINLPRLDGYSVVAVQLTDASNPAISISINHILHYPDTSYGVIAGTKYRDAFKKLGGKEPQIRYYLKRSPEIGKAIGTFVLTDGPYVLPAETVESSTKDGLGLSADASDSRIEATISSKLYSFTPFESTGVKPYVILTQPSETSFATLGRNLGGMSEMNCNVASTTLLLATNGENGTLNEAAGFHNNDDASLTNLEAHNWTVDGRGDIHDVTPSVKALNSPKPPSEISGLNDNGSYSLPIMPIGFIASGGLASMVLYRRRRQVASTFQTVHTFAATSGKSADVALQVLDEIQYRSKGSSVSSQPVSSEETGESWKETAQRIANPGRPLMSWPQARQVARQRDIDTSGVRPLTKVKMTQLYRARNSIRKVGTK